MIPTYQPGPFLVETLRGILAQDLGHQAMQIAVVDDASPQGDVAALVATAASAGRIEIHRNPRNLGLAGNWNRSVELARGELVHLLHQDDLILPGFYARLLEGLAREPAAGMAFCRHAFVDERGLIERISHREQRRAGLLPRWLDRISERQRIQCPAAIVRREAYESLGGFRTDLVFALDWEMWTRIAAHRAVWYEPGVLAHYRRHERAETARLETVGRTSADTMAAIEILSAHLPLARRTDLKHRAYRRLLRLHMRRAAKLLAAGQPQLAIPQIENARAVLDLLPGNFRTGWNRIRLGRLAKQCLPPSP